MSQLIPTQCREQLFKFLKYNLKNSVILTCFLFFVLTFTTGMHPYISQNNIQITNFNGIYIIKIPEKRNSNIYPYITPSLIYNREVYKNTNAELVINAGYFDANNKGTTSFVLIDEKTVLDPKTNYRLMNNKDLSPYINQILNRTEFRILNCKNKIQYDITNHYSKTPRKCSIKHSIQAGPMIYPKLKLTEEYFVAKDKNGQITRDSISALKKCARTVIGIKDNDIYIIIADIHHKMTLPEMHKLCKKLRLNKAMNFDGGGSTSLNFKGTNNDQYKNFEIVSDKNKSARKVKSFLVIE